MASTLRLRPATLDDLALLRRWDEEPHVIASDPNDDWGWERELARDPDWRRQLIAEVADEPIGFLQIIDPAREDGHYWGDCPDNLRAIDIWIGEPACLGRGFGTQMMKRAIALCFAEPSVEAILIDPLASNTRARRFYERLGFRFVEHRRFGLDDCAVYRLDRAGGAGSGYRHQIAAGMAQLLVGVCIGGRRCSRSDVKGLPSRATRSALPGSEPATQRGTSRSDGYNGHGF